MFQTFEMNLQPVPFEAIRTGEKTVEMRLFDQRRKDIRVGDHIVFVHTETQERLEVEVRGLQRFPSFVELYQAYDKKVLGYEEEETADPADMNRYYPPERVAQYGALAIEISALC